MADCEKLQLCPFFTGKIAGMPNVIELMKLTYCRGDKLECARYKVASAGLPVPANMFPNDLALARQMLRR